MVFDSIVEVRIYDPPDSNLRRNLLLRVLLARLMFQKVFQRMLEESSRDLEEGEEGTSYLSDLNFRLCARVPARQRIKDISLFQGSRMKLAVLVVDC